ncbi:retinol-binding protein pinta isoform X2 [Diabrotica virgifera virgifera]|nr:retinol-binding protein pinta isoform X2 [Diabrotica virgifera virgifera]XP_028140789.1 retinol-binding protein pinta isoform X2 [Diabrotica virgifera virgifera]XP_050511478.1 retinol-binding protein pinta isoform X2 [Diabrotica virgifera virgifera]
MEENKQEKKCLKLFQTNRDKIRKHWDKTESEVEEVLTKLREWASRKEFPEIPSDSMLEFFVTNNKYNIERTKDNIKSYYAVRKNIPEFFKNAHPRLPKMQECWEMGVYVPLAIPHEGLYRVSVLKLLPYTAKFHANRYHAHVSNLFEIRICEDLSVGEILIVDYRNLAWSHVFKISPFVVHRMAMVVESMSRTRLKEIHFVEPPSSINILLTIAKTFLKKKIADRIRIHNSMETLLEHVPKDILPEDYGGDGKPLSEQVDLVKEKLMEYYERFDMLQEYSTKDS